MFCVWTHLKECGGSLIFCSCTSLKQFRIPVISDVLSLKWFEGISGIFLVMFLKQLKKSQRFLVTCFWRNLKASWGPLVFCCSSHLKGFWRHFVFFFEVVWNNFGIPWYVMFRPWNHLKESGEPLVFYFWSTRSLTECRNSMICDVLFLK